MTPRDLVRLGAASVAVAWCGAAGASYVLGRGEAAFGPLVTGAIALVGAVFFACLFILIDLRYTAWLEKPATGATGATGTTSAPRAFPTLFTPRWDRRSILLFSLIMAAFWLPWLIANYPGGAYWDTYYQIQQVFPENHPISIIPFGDHGKDTVTDAYFCDHHPLLDTLVYGGFAAASQALTGEWNAGTFAFVILQGGATIVALTAAMAFLRKLGAPVALCFTAFAYFCVMPFVSTWAMTMVKDSLFSLVFIPYFMMLMNVVATRARSLDRPRAIAVFIVLGVLLCLTKKTGLYVVVPTALFAMVVLLVQRHRQRDRRGRAVAFPAPTPGGALGAIASAGADSATLQPRRTSLRPLAAFGGQTLACVLVMQVLMPWVVFPALNVAPGGQQEALGPLLQQTAAFVHEYRDEVSSEEMEAIDAVVPYGRLIDEYDPICQDPVKYYCRLDASDQDVRDYLIVWARMGLRHPETYLAATLAIGGSYLSPCQSLNIRTTTCDTWQGDAHVLYNPENLKPLREGMAALYDGYANLPVACLPVQAVVWTFWIPALLWLVARRHHAGDGMLFVPCAIVLAFCVIGPIFDARYCLSLLYTVPLLACFAFRGPSGNRPTENGNASRHPASAGEPAAPLPEPLLEKGPYDDLNRNAARRHHHGLEVRPGSHAAVHGPARCVRRAL